ncbi:MAG: hypothetical protein JAY74_20720 [Candidatus Thiodiazotropha taylori]|nr:hypothetical protein [Candidatus Thiodiazotropha taylori]
MKDSEIQMLNRLNEVIVTPEKIFHVVEMSEQWRNENHDSDGAGIFLIAQQYKNEPQRAQAVYFRMLAASRLLESEGAPGWVLPKQPDGAIPTKEELLRVVASHPLTFVDQDIGFENSSFLAKVLEISEYEGEA